MGYKGDLPVIALSDFNTQKTVFLPLTPSIQAAEVTEWIGGVLDGKIKPPLKSAPIPEKNNGPVTIVVGETFDQIVNDPTKDVLLEIYAPWCGHCKQLEPIYDKLGQIFEKYDTIRIAKIDGTENDHNVPNIQGYPTLLFFPANDKKIPLLFKGQRTLKDLEDFVRDSVSLPLSDQKDESEVQNKDEL
jgi:protein disulfide isomerase